MWMSHPNVTGVVTVADSAFYGGWDTLGWVTAAAPAGPPLVDAGWPVSAGEVAGLIDGRMKWKALTTYATGQQVVSPNNDVVSRITAGTSGATYDPTQWGLSSTYERPSVIAAAATGVAATDTANLQTAINACPVGGRLYIPSGTYFLNVPLVVTNHITIEGDSVVATYGSQTAGGSPMFPMAPYLSGTVLKQTVAAQDGILISGTSIAVNLFRLGILFADGLATTGHGINATPTQTYGTGHDMGVTDFQWENVTVYGHDGNHYAYYIVNPQYGQIIGARSYKGGGYCTVGDGNNYSYGNIVWTNPFSLLEKAGTAGGFVHNSGATIPVPGNLNLIVYIRPQCNIIGAAQTAATQPIYTDLAGAGIPDNITLISCDFESSNPNPFLPGKHTKFVGHIKTYGRNVQWTSFGDGALPYQAAGANTALGNNAIALNTTGNNNVGVGGSALAKNTTGSGNTAVGNIAAQNTIVANDVTAVGANALGSSTGNSNTAIGSGAAATTTSGTNNTAIGASALRTNAGGVSGTAVGASALYWFTGDKNTAVGQNAMSGNTGATGTQNTALGCGAGVTATSANTLTSGSSNTYLGYNTGLPSATQGGANTSVGFQALAGGTATGRATAVGASTSASAAGAVAIGVDSAGTGASSAVTDQFALGTALHTVKVLGRLNVAPRTPTSGADSSGSVGDIVSDDNYVYAKTSTGWKRSAITSW